MLDLNPISATVVKATMAMDSSNSDARGDGELPDVPTIAR